MGIQPVSSFNGSLFIAKQKKYIKTKTKPCREPVNLPGKMGPRKQLSED